MVNFAVAAVSLLLVKLISSSKLSAACRGHHHKFLPKKSFLPSQTKMSTRRNLGLCKVRMRTADADSGQL